MSRKSRGKTNSILEKYFKGQLIWAKVIPVSEKTFRQVYKRDLALV
jgi:hypothetical protein